MVKEYILLNGAQWLKSKNSVGFDQYFSIEVNIRVQRARLWMTPGRWLFYLKPYK